MSKKNSFVAGVVACGLLAGVSTLGLTTAASAHGWVGASGSQLVARQAMPANAGVVGAAAYDKQSFEAPKGFPADGPVDGHLPSAGVPAFSQVDQQKSDLWAKNEIKAGPVEIDWNYTAPHKTSQWRYYITKNGWNPNAPITRSDLQRISTIKHDGSAATTNPKHFVDVPADHHGYHVIYAVWDVADTPNAFYNAIDVDIEGESAPDTQAPSTPSGLSAHHVATTSATIRWKASTDDVGVAEYRVLRDGKVVGSVSAPELTDTGLSAETAYEYQVQALDAAGNVSGTSHALTITTKALPAKDESAPTKPTGLHAMAVDPRLVTLMWTESVDDVGVDHYVVTRTEGHEVKTFRSDATMFDDTTVKPGKKYHYTVRAVDAAGNKSGHSQELEVSTPKADAADDDNQVSAPRWNPFGTYEKGDVVAHDGRLFEAVQGSQGAGDPNWINAPSLWKSLS